MTATRAALTGAVFVYASINRGDRIDGPISQPGAQVG